MFFKYCATIPFLFLLFISSGFAEEKKWEDPWLTKPSQSVAQARAQESAATPAQKAVEGLLWVFKNYISPVDGDRCPCYPTCSQYALEAVRKHGALIGTVMAFDRLIHETDEMHMAPLIRVYDSYRYYDPVENNDFWWNNK
jgi:uncharacterized protein